MSIISSLFKPKPFFTEEEKQRIVETIRKAERTTSGEIRVFIESRNKLVDVLERAKEIFFQLKMEKTELRNAVLVYVAMKDKEIALFGDEGIYSRTGKVFWDNTVAHMLSEFAHDDVVAGICHCISEIGLALQKEFPYEPEIDKNELPDDIVFGK